MIFGLCVFFVYMELNVIFWKMSQKCEHIPYEMFGGILLGLLVLNGPLTSLKHPSEGYNMRLDSDVDWSFKQV